MRANHADRTRGYPVCAALLVSLVALAVLPSGPARAADATEAHVGPGNATLYRDIGPGYAIGADHGAAAVARFLTDQGWDEDGIGTLVETRLLDEARTGARIVIFGQEADGLAVYDASVKAIFDAGGALVTLNADLADAGGPVVPARVGPRAALDAALGAVHPGLGARLVERGRSGNSVAFGGDDFFFRDPNVTQVAIPGPGAALNEAFLVETWSDAGNQLDHTIVDGAGAVIHVEHRTVNDSYNIFEEHPFAGAQTTDLTAGWLGGGSQYTTHIVGPNADAYLDQNFDNLPDGAGTPAGVDFTAAHDPSVEPWQLGNDAVAVQNLFYLNNRIHDELAAVGFDAAAGNFEGADPVLAEAQDYRYTNNANFAPTDDCTSPRMQMYLWDTNNTGGPTYRDSALDGDVVLHEYGHGVTSRLIGNLVGFMGGAVGEGWSDTYSFIRYDDPIVGEYSYNDPTGIRNYPYDTYFEDSGGRTYEDFVGEVHADGEIFAAIEWGIWAAYRDDPAIAALGAQDEILADMIAGMKITAGLYEYRPDFIDMRDGLLRAISGLPSPFTAPAPPDALTRWCYVWTANAKYGVGVDAITTVNRKGRILQWQWYNGFEIPAECAGPPPDPDETPPSPDPSQWETLPQATGSSTIAMTALLASDDSGGTVEYFFECATGCGDSGWQTSRSYVADGLAPATSYTFRVKTRDPSGNETAWSSSESATTDDAPAGGTVGVTAIAYGGHGGKNNDRHLDVYLTVKDDGGAPVAGAVVSVTVHHHASSSTLAASATSDASGIAVVTWNNAPGPVPPECYWTDVTGISGTALAWDGVEQETENSCP